MSRQKTFCGYPIDNSQLLFAFVHLAPTRDVEAGEMYPIGKGGYGLAEKPVKTGETAAFMILPCPILIGDREKARSLLREADNIPISQILLAAEREK